jgi:hypothetical protein
MMLVKCQQLPWWSPRVLFQGWLHMKLLPNCATVVALCFDEVFVASTLSDIEIWCKVLGSVETDNVLNVTYPVLKLCFVAEVFRWLLSLATLQS